MFFPHLNVRCLVFFQEWYHQIEALCDSSMDAKTNKTFKKKRLWGIHHYGPIFADFCHLLFVPSSVPHNVRKESPMTCQSLGNPTKVVLFSNPKKVVFFWHGHRKNWLSCSYIVFFLFRSSPVKTRRREHVLRSYDKLYVEYLHNLAPWNS